jgi:hypothetical protein
MCDPRDIRRTLGDGDGDGAAPGRDLFSRHTGGFEADSLLFDAVPGGSASPSASTSAPRSSPSERAR